MQGQEEGETANWHWVSFWGDENDLEYNCWLHNFVNILKTTELCTLKQEFYGI